MDQTINQIAMIMGILGVSIATIPTFVRHLMDLARDRDTRRLEVVIGDQRFVIDVDHLEQVPFAEIENALHEARSAHYRRRTLELEAA